MTPRVRDFTLKEIQQLTNTAPHTPSVWVVRGQLRASLSCRVLVVGYQDARNFVWKYLVSKLPARSKKTGFTLREISQMTRVAKKTPNMWVRRGQLKALRAKDGTFRVVPHEAKEFVLKFLIDQLSVPSGQQQTRALVQSVGEPSPVYRAKSPAEQKQIGSRQLVTREAARKYLGMSKEEFQKFSFDNFDQMDFICGKGLWPAQFLNAHKVQLARKKAA